MDFWWDFQEKFGGRAAGVKLVEKFCITHKWETNTTGKYKQEGNPPYTLAQQVPL